MVRDSSGSSPRGSSCLPMIWPGRTPISRAGSSAARRLTVTQDPAAVAQASPGKTLLRKRGRVGIEACGAPNQGLESSFCCGIARQRLSCKRCARCMLDVLHVPIPFFLPPAWPRTEDGLRDFNPPLHNRLQRATRLHSNT